MNVELFIVFQEWTVKKLLRSCRFVFMVYHFFLVGDKLFLHFKNALHNFFGANKGIKAQT